MSRGEFSLEVMDNSDQNQDSEIFRPVVGGSAKKVGLRIKELERIYGIREGSFNEKGNNRIGDTNNFNDQSKNVPKTEKELAEQLGITQQTIQNYKKLSEMIPELEELIDTDIITTTTET